MKRCTHAILAILLAGTFISASGAVVRSEGPQPTSRPQLRRTALLAVLDVERQSQAYYRGVLDKHRPLHPFGMVYRLELRHEQVLVDALKQHAVAVPEDRYGGRRAAVPDSRSEAMERAVELEKRTAAAYDKAIRRTRAVELRRTLERLRDESLEHQKWFENPDSCPGGGRRGGGGGGGGGGGRRGTAASRAGAWAPTSTKRLRLGQRLVPQAAAHECAQVEHEGQADRVADEVSFLFPRQDAGVVKDAQLLRRVRLLDAGGPHDLAHARRSGLERLEDAQPARLRQRGEKFGNRLELRLAEARGIRLLSLDYHTTKW